MKKYLILLCAFAAFLSSCESTTQNNPPVPLGDVGNDIQYINGKLYMVLDNSDKIVVGTPAASSDDRIFILDQGNYTHNNASLDSWDWTDTMLATNLFTSSSASDHTTISFPAKSIPWKILQISSTEALASENSTGEMAVINLTTNTISSTIEIGSGQNSLVALGNYVYTTTGSNTIVSIDKSQKTVHAQKYIGESPQQVIADSLHNQLIVFTSGNFSPKTPGKILWVNPATLAITDSLIIDTLHYINEIVPGLASGNKAYVLFADSVRILDITSHKLTSDPLFTKAYYGGYLDAAKNLLYLGTAVDFTNNDVVDVFDLNAHTLKRTLHVGIAPAFFAVVRP